MRGDSEIASRLRRLQWSQSLAWGAAWVLGVGFLATVAVRLSERVHTGGLDAELALHATAVYGLTWFDAQGAFHDEALRLENDLLEGPIELWVVESGDPPTVHLAPVDPRFRIENLNSLVREVVDGQAERFEDGGESAGELYLATVHWIARLHGGRLRLENPAGGGACAVFELGPGCQVEFRCED